MYLVSQGGGKKGDLSRFIEEALRAHIPKLTVEQVKADNAKVNEKEMASIIDEALQWARKR